MSYGKVYLAGPITGLTYGDSVDWRRFAERFLEEWDIEALSPMRGKKYLEAVGIIEDVSYGEDNAEWALSAAAGFTQRDHGDCMNSDVVLCNFLGADRVSIGTVLEVAWAHAYRKQLIVVVDAPIDPPADMHNKPWHDKNGVLRSPDGRNIHDHAMIRQVAGYVVPTLEHGLNLIPAILNAKRAGAVDYRRMDFTPPPVSPQHSPIHFDVDADASPRA